MIIINFDQIAEIDASGTIKYVHQDVSGSTMLVTNQSGKVEQNYEYEPFGQLVGGTMNSDDKQRL